ncbi:hypothetical protein B0H13DRAFT_2263982 [Mycena leptocephala]|nr:hypothetical protein B0H13DRAFT_2263982 [Mycena leptocephala]
MSRVYGDRERLAASAHNNPRLIPRPGRPRNSSQSHIDIPRELSPSRLIPTPNANAQPASPNPYYDVQGGGGPGRRTGTESQGRPRRLQRQPAVRTPAGLSLGHMLRRRRRREHPAAAAGPRGARADGAADAGWARAGADECGDCEWACAANGNTNAKQYECQYRRWKRPLAPHPPRPAPRLPQALRFDAISRDLRAGRVWARGGECAEHEQDCLQEQGCESRACGGVDRGSWLSAANTESRPHQIKDGDILQLGVDYQGGAEDIYKSVKIRVELGREWQAGVNAFKTFALGSLVARCGGSVSVSTAGDNDALVSCDELASGTPVQSVTGESHDRPQEPQVARHRASPSAPAASGGVASAGPRRKGSTGMGIPDCCICLFPVSIRQALFIAPCSHAFHYKCLRPLLETHHPGFRGEDAGPQDVYGEDSASRAWGKAMSSSFAGRKVLSSTSSLVALGEAGRCVRAEEEGVRCGCEESACARCGGRRSPRLPRPPHARRAGCVRESRSATSMRGDVEESALRCGMRTTGERARRSAHDVGEECVRAVWRKALPLSSSSSARSSRWTKRVRDEHARRLPLHIVGESRRRQCARKGRGGASESELVEGFARAPSYAESRSTRCRGVVGPGGGESTRREDDVRRSTPLGRSKRDRLGVLRLSAEHRYRPCSGTPHPRTHRAPPRPTDRPSRPPVKVRNGTTLKHHLALGASCGSALPPSRRILDAHPCDESSEALIASVPALGAATLRDESGEAVEDASVAEGLTETSCSSSSSSPSPPLSLFVLLSLGFLIPLSLALLYFASCPLCRTFADLEEDVEVEPEGECVGMQGRRAGSTAKMKFPTEGEDGGEGEEPRKGSQDGPLSRSRASAVGGHGDQNSGEGSVVHRQLRLSTNVACSSPVRLCMPESEVYDVPSSLGLG